MEPSSFSYCWAFKKKSLISSCWVRCFTEYIVLVEAVQEAPAKSDLTMILMWLELKVSNQQKHRFRTDGDMDNN
jgi:hypothetical protein